MNFRWRISRVSIFYLFLIILTIVGVSLLACVPPVDRDALTHHLYVPKLYLLKGGIQEIPYIPFSYYPMNLDLLYIIPLYFNNDIAPKFIHFLFALITALMIFRYLRSRVNTEYALLGSLFFLSIPVIARLSSTVYVDLGLICFLFASLLSLFGWIKSELKLKYLIFSGIFCGLALGTKYNGLLGFFLLAMFVPFIYSRCHPKKVYCKLGSYRAISIHHGLKSLFCGMIFVFVSILVFSPWMIRNLVWTGNPVYPLYQSVFNPKSSASLSEVKEQDHKTILEKRDHMTHIQIRKNIYGESWVKIGLIPLRVFFQGKDDNPKYFDGRMNPFLLILPIFAFLGFSAKPRQEQIELCLMLAFSLLMLLYTCALTSIRIRYFSPIIPPLVVLSIIGLFNFQARLNSNSNKLFLIIKKSLVLTIILVMLGLNASWFVDRFKRDQPLAYISGKITREEYIQHFRHEYAALQYANKNLNKNSKIFGLYLGNRGYYSDLHIEFSLIQFQKSASVAQKGSDIAKSLYEQGFTHLLINQSLFNYWVQKYSIHERLMLKDFFTHYTDRIFLKDGCSLLLLKFP